MTTTRVPAILRAASSIMLALPVILAGQPSLSVSSVPGFPGTTVAVPVSLGRATNIVAAQFEVTFDTNTLVSGTAISGQPSARQFVRSREVSPGVRRVVAYSLTKPLSTNRATIARLPFTLAPNVRDSSGPITPRNVVLASTDATALAPVAMHSGTIFTQPLSRAPDGTVRFFLRAEEDQRYRIEATTDFLQWLPVSTNLASGSFLDLVDHDAPLFPRRFYRSLPYDARPALSEVTLLPEGTLSFAIIGEPGRSYALETSTNLIDWQHVRTVILTTGHMHLTNAPIPNTSRQFFRVAPSP